MSKQKFNEQSFNQALQLTASLITMDDIYGMVNKLPQEAKDARFNEFHRSTSDYIVEFYQAIEEAKYNIQKK